MSEKEKEEKLKQERHEIALLHLLVPKHKEKVKEILACENFDDVRKRIDSGGRRTNSQIIVPK